MLKLRQYEEVFDLALLSSLLGPKCSEYFLSFFLMLWALLVFFFFYVQTNGSHFGCIQSMGNTSWSRCLLLTTGDLWVLSFLSEIFGCRISWDYRSVTRLIKVLAGTSYRASSPGSYVRVGTVTHKSTVSFLRIKNWFLLIGLSVHLG